MANKPHWNAQSRTRELKTIEGIIKIVGAVSAANNAVTLETLTGDGVSTVARTNAGEYTITLDDAYPALLGANFTLQAATAIDLVPQIESHDVVTARTIVVNLCAGATPTDTANGVTHYIHFSIKLKNSKIK